MKNEPNSMQHVYRFRSLKFLAWVLVAYIVLLAGKEIITSSLHHESFQMNWWGFGLITFSLIWSVYLYRVIRFVISKNGFEYYAPFYKISGSWNNVIALGDGRGLDESIGLYLENSHVEAADWYTKRILKDGHDQYVPVSFFTKTKFPAPISKDDEIIRELHKYIPDFVETYQRKSAKA